MCGADTCAQYIHHLHAATSSSYSHARPHTHTRQSDKEQDHSKTYNGNLNYSRKGTHYTRYVHMYMHLQLHRCLRCPQPLVKKDQDRAFSTALPGNAKDLLNVSISAAEPC